MVTYLEKLAAGVDAEIHTSTRATAVETSGRGFVVRTNTGTDFKAAGVICASGSFSNPYLPQIPGDFSGQLLHVANYRGPGQYAGQGSLSSAPATPRSRSATVVKALAVQIRGQA